jgi:AcrR family transcriptional regulator
VVHAARERFLTEGVEGASLRAIAADAGTSIGMVYYYYPTKDDLFLAVVEETYLHILKGMEAALDPAVPVRERIERLYLRLAALDKRELKVVRLVIREALSSPPRLERIVERFKRGHVPLMLKLVGEGFATGLFDPKLHPGWVIAALAALGGPAQLLLSAAAGKLPIPLGPTREETAVALVDVLLNGVAPRAERSAPRPKRKRR